jgi:small subunit ribosomal protein S18
MFRGKKGKKKRIIKKRLVVKGCRLCKEKITEIDYKDISKIRKYVSGRGKILSASITGNCAKHQRALTRAIKRARFMAMLPFVQT